MAQIHREYRKKPATSLHTDFASYIKKTTGHDADVETVKLALMLTPAYRDSEENAKRKAGDQAAKDKALKTIADEKAQKKQAIRDRQATAVAEKRERLRAKLAALGGDDDEAPAPAPRKAAAKTVPAKAPAKAPAKKVAPVKRALKAVAPVAEVAEDDDFEDDDEATEERGALRDGAADDDGWEDEPEAY